MLSTEAFYDSRTTYQPYSFLNGTQVGAFEYNRASWIPDMQELCIEYWKEASLYLHNSNKGTMDSWLLAGLVILPTYLFVCHNLVAMDLYT